MKNSFSILNSQFSIIIALAMMTGCEEPVYPPINTGDLTGVNQWTYTQMHQWYYWDEELKAADMPANSLHYDDFLDRLVLNTGGVDPDGTMDGSVDGGSRTIYSHIDRYTSTRYGTRGVSYQTTFGFGFQAFNSSGNTIPYYMLITWVQPGSAADDAGLRRGMWIKQYNGVDIGSMGYPLFWNQVHHLIGGTQMKITLSDTFNGNSGLGEITLTARQTKVSPIIHSDVLTTTEGRKVAYLFYNSFEEGAGGEFDTELRHTFGDFIDRGVDELVLDLRYNPGGLVSSAKVLASLMGDVDGNDVFVKMMFNKYIGGLYNWGPRIENFRNEGNSLGLKKVYVLATGHSASASELVINSLRGVDIEVVHIGERTEGKNVGSNALPISGEYYKSGGYAYKLWAITFKLSNAKNFGSYATGFVPDYQVNEYRELYGGTKIICELGDPNETLLKAALTLVDGGVPAVDAEARTRTAGEISAPVDMPKDPRRGGNKWYLNDSEL